MTSHEILVLVLRGMGFWTTLRAINGLSTAIANVFPIMGMIQDSKEVPGEASLVQVALVFGLQPLVELIVATALLFASPRIASYFYSSESEPTTACTNQSVSAAICFGMGSLALLWCIRPASFLVAMGVRWNERARTTEHDIAYAAQLVLYFGMACALYLAARRISAESNSGASSSKFR